MKDRTWFENLFGVSVPDMDRVIAAALSNGATYADIFFEHSTFRDILLRDGSVSSAGLHTDFGTGIRALHGEKTGYSYCESTEMAEMLAAAKAAGSIARCGAANYVAAPYQRHPGQTGDFYPAALDWEESSNAELAAVLRGIEARLRERDSRIIKVIGRISSSQSSVMMYNSAGQLAMDFRPSGNIIITIIFSDGKTTENRSESRSMRMGAEMLTAQLQESIVERLLSGVDAALEARRPKGGVMPVVMGAGASGILLHEAMGHAFEADFNRKGQSIFGDSMGKRVCPAGINVVDDATLRFNRGACNFDDEGVAGQKTYMVTDGILTSYLHDRISAAYYGVAPTGNGRRESFRFSPLPRMRTTYMESGSIPPADIIASVRKGIYVDEFSNGQVKIGEGDFTFYVKSGRLIENGRLTMPIKDINVIGNGPEALAGITAVGNDLKIDDSIWTCGKEQNVPVGCGMPTVLVDRLTVGGE